MGTYFELSSGGEAVLGSSDVGWEGPGLALAGDGIEGWWSTPQPKVSLAESAMGHGAYVISDADVLYSARTVTLHVAALAESREAAEAIVTRVGRMAGRVVTLHVVSEGSDTSATGYISVDWQAGWSGGAMSGTLTVVCPDPRRYGPARTVALVPGDSGGGGLVWDPSARSLTWPLDWGDVGSGSVATLANAGSATAWPAFELRGMYRPRLAFSDGGALEYGDSAPWGAPLTLDCLSRTAETSGVDVTGRLSERHFPGIPPGGTLTVGLSATGRNLDGRCLATATVRDTYI